MEVRETPQTMDEMWEEAQPWRWRNLRSVGFGIQIWPIEWGWGVHRSDDRFGGMIALELGPISLRMDYNDGSAMHR